MPDHDGPFEYSFHATVSSAGARLLVVGKPTDEPRGQYRPITVWDAVSVRVADHDKNQPARKQGIRRRGGPASGTTR